MTGTDAFLDDVIGTMPEVSAAAENIALTAQQNIQEDNPNAQQAPNTGKKSRGRPRKDGSAAVAKTQNAPRLGGFSTPEKRDLAAQDAERMATAQLMTGLIEITGVQIGGKSAAMIPEEKAGMVGAWERYFRVKGINDIPPGVALVLVCGQYYGRALMQPAAEPKVKKMKNWFKSKFLERKFARFINRDDKQRKDDTGEKAGAEVQSGGDTVDRT